MHLDGVILSLGGGEGGLGLEASVQSVFETVKAVWKSVGAPVILVLCIDLLLLCSRRLRHQAVRLGRCLVCCWDSLLRDLVRLMPFHPQGDSPGIGIESLRRRVNSLDRLLRTSLETNRVRRSAEPAVGIPVVRSSRWEILGSFVAGLWCGCIVSLLALCIGVYIGHSL